MGGQVEGGEQEWRRKEEIQLMPCEKEENKHNSLGSKN